MSTSSPERIYRRRKAVNSIALLLSGSAALVGIFFLAWILFTTVSEGLSGFSPRLVSTQMVDGGLGNAMLGSIVICATAIAMATPIGIAAGTYLAEYANFRKIGSVIRFVNDILLSAPSIVLGLFVYTILIGIPKDASNQMLTAEWVRSSPTLSAVVAWINDAAGYSGFAGAVALGFIVLPVVVRTTDEMLRLVPPQMREAALSLGIPQWKVTVQVLYRAALSGILTGVMLGLARISGETAPLLFTALGYNFWRVDVTEEMSTLPQAVYQFARQPGTLDVAWAGAFLITCFVLLVSVTARTLLLRKKIAHD